MSELWTSVGRNSSAASAYPPSENTSSFLIVKHNTHEDTACLNSEDVNEFLPLLFQKTKTKPNKTK